MSTEVEYKRNTCVFFPEEAYNFAGEKYVCRV